MIAAHALPVVTTPSLETLPAVVDCTGEGGAPAGDGIAAASATLPAGGGGRPAARKRRVPRAAYAHAHVWLGVHIDVAYECAPPLGAYAGFARRGDGPLYAAYSTAPARAVTLRVAPAGAFDAPGEAAVAGAGAARGGGKRGRAA